MKSLPLKAVSGFERGRMGGKKRKRKTERASIHPRNKYAENPPDFRQLASLYASFQPYVFYSADGKAKIDWTDFNATRELTRVLLLHDHGISWWIPDGQLCPTVPNRSNYIHWVEDLLSSDIIPNTNLDRENVRGFDIGTGANCIYPLLGSSLLGWSFVGSDVTDVALEWAETNVKNNPHLSELIEIRKATGEETQASNIVDDDRSLVALDTSKSEDGDALPSCSHTRDVQSDSSQKNLGHLILVGVVKDGETFDFCMCNPPFFDDMEKAGLNPKTACGGTSAEMACPGGEKAFILRIIEDSVVLKQSFRWYTSMVGRKVNLKFLMSKLREVGVTVVKTTEFVQGQTCRWGLAWSFVAPAKKMIPISVSEKSVMSFMLEGVQRQFSAMHVLQYAESFFTDRGASCKLNASLFTVDVTASDLRCNAIYNTNDTVLTKSDGEDLLETSKNSESTAPTLSRISFCVCQSPGTLLVRGTIQQKDNIPSGVFSLVFQQLEATMQGKFCKMKPL
uniref:U6 small nuclear RNA (adenine-(43)-N(6))-methyltransferase n=1 Tax=Kalanchoe fedtschenkoi TaxID=63787 RepID=A0A7N0UVV7_KALFE